MNNISKKSTLFLLMSLAIILLAGCSSSSQQGTQSNGLIQSSTGGPVTIDVKWLGIDNDSLIFDVSMNTHSVDLDSYDLSELAVLIDDTGNKFYPTSWDSAPGGHHRKGIITFPVPDSIIQEKTEYFEMLIRDVAGVENRVLKWEL